eukprot:Em0940g2a
MLTTPPWSRLPLTLRWLKQEYQVYFPPDRPPPPHMPLAYGPVEICKSRGGVSSCKSSRNALGSGKRAGKEEVLVEEEEVMEGVEEEVEEEEEVGGGGGGGGGGVEEEVVVEQEEIVEEFLKCMLCSIENQLLPIVGCYHKGCSMSSHITCLAPRICDPDQVIPVTGSCPGCGRELLDGGVGLLIRADLRGDRFELTLWF